MAKLVFNPDGDKKPFVLDSHKLTKHTKYLKMSLALNIALVLFIIVKHLI